MTDIMTGPHPEPVPPASQLAVLPFASAVEGFLTGPRPSIKLRLTVHRIMGREGQQYLQQICKYLGPQSSEPKLDTGRLFPVNHGIMGQALEDANVLRTRHYANRETFQADLRSDFLSTGRDLAKLATEPLSWLAVPFQTKDGRPVLVLYADCHEFNFFAADARVESVVEMCWGFTRLIDGLEADPLPNLRNFAFDTGVEVKGAETVYPTVQERVTKFPIPTFQTLKSFNYESSVG
jgi:hypothetical protein